MIIMMSTTTMMMIMIFEDADYVDGGFDGDDNDDD